MANAAPKGTIVYTDASRNPITAIEVVDTLLGPVQRAFENFGPIPAYRYDNGVNLHAYEGLLTRYNELFETANRGMLSLRLQTVRLEIENRKLRAELARRSE